MGIMLIRDFSDSSDVRRSTETQISDEASVREFSDEGRSYRSRYTHREIGRDKALAEHTSIDKPPFTKQ